VPSTKRKISIQEVAFVRQETQLPAATLHISAGFSFPQWGFVPASTDQFVNRLVNNLRE